MKVKVNGEEHEHCGGGTVMDLLGELGADVGRVAVMLNDRIVPRAEFAVTRLKDGDLVEVLTFMGGG